MLWARAGPTQLHDIASGKYYLGRCTDHCEGRAHGSGRKGEKTRLVMPEEGAVQASNQGRIKGSRAADWLGWLVFHGWSAYSGSCHASTVPVLEKCGERKEGKEIDISELKK